jgi:hypothetical protein
MERKGKKERKKYEVRKEAICNFWAMMIIEEH